MGNNIKSNLFYSITFQLIHLLVPLFTIPYITRVLDSNGIGVFSYASAVASYFSLFILLGLNSYGSRTIATIRDEKEKLSNIFSEIYAFQVICGAVIIILYFYYIYFFCNEKIIGLAFSFQLLATTLDISWFYSGLEKFKLLAIRNASIKILSLICVFLFVKESDDLFIYCIIISLSMLFSSVFFWFNIRKYIYIIIPSFPKIKKHIVPNTMLFIAVLVVSLYKLLDKIMLGILSTYSEVGFFEVSEKMISVPVTFIVAFGAVMLPHISNKVSTGSNDTKRYIYLSILFIMFLSSSVSFGIMGISKEFVPLFFGPNYGVCITLFNILLPSCLFIGFANVLRTQYLVPYKMDYSFITSTIVGAVINVFSNLLLIPSYGAKGASVSTLLAEIGVCCYQCWILRKRLPIIMYITDSIPFVMSGVIMFGVLYLIDFSDYGSVNSLFFKIILGGIIYITTLLTLVYPLRKYYLAKFFIE